MGSEPVGTASMDGIEVESNTSSSKDLEKSLRSLKSPEDQEKQTSDAAAELGRKGGEASAKSRAEREKVAASEEETGKEPEDKPSTASPADEEKPADAPEETEEEKKYREEGERRKRDAKSRVEQATRAAADARRALEESQSQVGELRQEIEALKRIVSPEPEKDKGSEEPNLESYSDFQEYLKDLRAFDRRQIREEIMSTLSEREAQRSETDAVDRALENRIDEAREIIRPVIGEWAPELRAAKFEFQLGEGEEPSGENWIMNEFLFDPKIAPPLGRYFTEHPDEFQRVAALQTPRDVTHELAVLVTRLEAATSTGEETSSPEPEKTKSKAPPPVTPVRGAPYTDDGIGSAIKPGEPFDNWRKRRDRIRPIVR